MESTKTKACNRCDIGRAKLGNKYCGKCRSIVLNELQSTGYLSDPYVARRPSEQWSRSQRHGSTVGGSAELNSDGDE